ncbi:histidine kinase [Streptomyces sp. ISL-86]|uniref:histidine kinase n=1 Tax=Streptomyces sp. ISL-86 TaxID=2819187 RepID=UPI001BE957AA|nr:histidine kinase [Streptomyces sp. ISL-86]MBT2459893.1 hypothetical protein [Streptomyces sp. ISL-86]
MSSDDRLRYVALGDSQTEGVGDGDDTVGLRGFADRLAETLAVHNSGVHYANLAVRGRLAGQVREEQLAPALALRPGLATVVAGVNDLLRPRFDADEVAGHLEAMFEELTARGARVATVTFPDVTRLIRWAAALFAPVPLILLIVIVILLGEVITVFARRLLGPSAAERLTALEARTEQLLERTRIARELHDSIGHALTVAVVQAGAARAAGDPEFTDRALSAIEETGRAALEDLERVLLVLRESAQPPSQRPTLAEADRLLESARASGAAVDAQLTGPLEKLPGPVTREGYRILQEALTNVLRHCGSVPVRVRIEMTADRLDLEVANPLPERPTFMSGSGSGLRGMRERAALLGGEAETGPHEGSWRVRARLPLDRIR